MKLEEICKFCEEFFASTADNTEFIDSIREQVESRKLVVGLNHSDEFGKYFPMVGFESYVMGGHETLQIKIAQQKQTDVWLLPIRGCGPKSKRLRHEKLPIQYGLLVYYPDNEKLKFLKKFYAKNEPLVSSRLLLPTGKYNDTDKSEPADYMDDSQVDYTKGASAMFVSLHKLFLECQKRGEG